MDAFHRAFEDIVLLFKPREKAGNIAADIVNSHIGAVVDFLIFRQIFTHFLGCDLPHRSCNCGYQMFNGLAVVFNCALRASLDSFRIKEHFEILRIADFSLFRSVLGEHLQNDLLQLLHLADIQILRHLVQYGHDLLFHVGIPLSFLVYQHPCDHNYIPLLNIILFP